MDIYRYVNGEALSLLFVFFTAFTVATLVPPVHRFLPRPIQALTWIGFVALAIVQVARVTDPEVREATTALVWAAGQLIYTQVAVLQAAVQGWIAAHGFAVAALMAVVAGADILALALIHSHRSALRSMPRVRLGEWFELPRPGAAPVQDPVVELDHRLAAMTRTAFHNFGRSAAARAMFVKPFAHAATHLLGPGPARLRMVKLALGFEGHVEQSPNGAQTAPAGRDKGSSRPAQPARTGAPARHPVRLHHPRTRRQWRGTRVFYIDKLLTASPGEPRTRTVQPGEGKDVAPAQPADRLAS